MSRSPSTATPTASPHRGAAGPVPIGRTSPFREAVGPADDVLEREADRVADAVLSGGMQHAVRAGGWAAAQRRDEAVIRRAPAERAEVAPSRGAEAPAPTPAATPSPTTKPSPAPAAMTQEKDEADAPTAAAGGARIVADGVTPGPGQMKKSAFMTALRTDICTNVDAGLAGTGRDSQGCPWIDHWLGYYQERSAAELERALRRYAPEAASASEAGDYIRFVAARVRKSAQRWAKTGEITDLPQDMPDATPGGGLLAGFGGMFFKARAGGARPADAASVQRQLGAGESLPGGLRMRMEGAFGTSFGGVRLHTDTTAARLSNTLNARAFAIGPHVAFAGGEFQPGTLVGDALIAHELAHVVQQGHAHAAAVPLHKEYEGDTGGERPGGSNALEHDADVSAAHVTASLWGGGPTRSARPRLNSGLRLQRCASSPKVATPGAKVKLTIREECDASIADAGKRLREVDKWASLEQKKQNVPGIEGVIKLDKEQATNVEQAIQLLTKANGLFATQAANALPGKLDEVVAAVRSAGKLRISSGGGDPLNDLESNQARTLGLIQASNALDEAIEMVTKLGQTLKVTEISKHVAAIASMLDAIKADPSSVSDHVRDIEKESKAAKQALTDARRLLDKTPPALKRIVFVLRSFLALNAPGRVAAPTAAEIKAFTDTPHGGIGDDFSIVFGEGMALRGFDVFAGYADVLEHQIAVRAQMAAAKVEAASPVPTQGNAEDYFKSLKGKGNDELITAYQAYAAGYFYHRGVDKFGDMKVSGVAELYTRPLSIYGLRPLVCTGYAMLGAHLLELAGAKLKKFVVAVLATEDDIVNDRIGVGHALAHLTRKGQDLWVTNATIEASKADAQKTIGWDPKDKTMREATGPTVPEANARLEQALGELMQASGRRRAPKK